MTLAYSVIREALAAQPLFEDKTWQISPEAWGIRAHELKEIESIGLACLEFYRAMEFLYIRSSEGKNILRNGKLETAWVADYLNRGKPDQLIKHGLSPKLRNNQPMIIRPDLLITETGFALTEIDSVPGGIGLTAFLNRLYASETTIGHDDRMLDLFIESLSALRPDKENPIIGIVVSDEAATYRPEMEWLAAELQERGKRVYCLHTSDLLPIGDRLCADIDGNPEELDIVYRFWEMFDIPNLPIMDAVFNAIEKTPLVVTPPMRTFQEEKMNLALFHHPRLDPFWREQLSRRSLRVLQKIIPRSWIMDPVDLPPNAVLDAPLIGGQPIHNWMQLAEASKKERNLIVKLSGFHENAWGARSVIFGSDASKNEWEDGIRDVIKEASVSLSVLQNYEKPIRRTHPLYRAEGAVRDSQVRVRLCPYYFVKGDEVELGGILSTACPADKKIIHGMRDAAMLPSRVVQD